MNPQLSATIFKGIRNQPYRHGGWWQGESPARGKGTQRAQMAHPKPVMNPTKPTLRDHKGAMYEPSHTPL